MLKYGIVKPVFKAQLFRIVPLTVVSDSENLYRRQADLLVELGYKDLGYVYVNIDDCWMEMQRDNLTDRLVADKKRFPNGIKALADYVHQKGLKLGIYTDIGSKTCGGYPGTQDHYDIDAQTLAEWEIDMLKVDGCYANASDFAVEYPALGRSLNNTGRPILYSCSWPAYQDDKDFPIIAGTSRKLMWQKDYVAIAEHCNIWRNWDDIEDSWASITSIAKYFGDRGDAMVPTAGPGNYHDPDMLVIGNYGLSCPEAQVQMSIWAILAAPLLISADLQQVPPCHEAVLKNKDLIAANQDPLGMMGERVYKVSLAFTHSCKLGRKYSAALNQELKYSIQL
ncbi:hypothetical protein LAZ67_4003038 [Cordylochernes scorpioides]|uniref:Alpha-galactosidase n=1 Tax=Cordylochernes scorpioides TaxID=51811 RepID=A0ABY6KDB4_9ARAC|nr:hypothetical protein LAZ67_4003038 [Cordylochernes scorpioides]